jgi:single-strand DNA-binding protein
MLGMNIVGRLVRDTTIKFVGENGSPVSNFTIAVDTGWGKNKEAVFIGCSLWGKQAESLDAYLKKGVLVHVTGQGGLRKWDNDKGNGAEITCRVSDINPFLEKRADTDAPSPQADGFRKPEPPVTADSFADDDIPF